MEKHIYSIVALFAAGSAARALIVGDTTAAVTSMGVLICVFIDAAERAIVAAIKDRE
jgi:hypothetical protein